MAADYTKVDLTRTVCAIATPLGRGALGIVRLSGPEAIAIVDRVFRPSHVANLASQPGYSIHHGYIVETPSDTRIDEVIVSLFRAPKSFTGEDLVEITGHGGPTVIRRIAAVLASNGAELALPGEFTLRAFLNGRIDLTQAEAVAEITNAKTDEAAGAALAQLQGSLNSAIARLREELIAAMARLEMGIDFTEEDLDPRELADVGRRFQAVATQIDQLLAGYNRGRILRDGFVVVLAGPPNVGKSTLFNRLAQDERAIVTEIPGTTRDILREFINLDGYPVCLIDTAGIHDATDLVEKIGVERSHGAVRSADGAIWLIDGSMAWLPQRPPESFRDLSIPWLIAVNKLDLLADPAAAVRNVAAHNLATLSSSSPVIGISAQTGDGVENVIDRIRQWIAACDTDRQSAPIVINDRHRDALLRAQQSIAQARESLNEGRSPEVVAFDANCAAIAVGEIIGTTTTEDILSDIFSSFCIGK
ncbi:MAG: tRNA uridine-5-carboxymethylaminomethyl(34) synthesis GTPase MnmE [Candidatus Zixiibacteriota bacterium]